MSITGCVDLKEICGTLNSICPDNALMNVWPPKAVKYSSPGRVLVGWMRNSNIERTYGQWNM